MVRVVLVGREIHDQRRLALQPQRARGDEGRLEAMGLAMTQHAAYRPQAIAAVFEIGREGGHVFLHALRRAQGREDTTFRGGEAEFCRGGAFASAHRVQLCRDAPQQASE